MPLVRRRDGQPYVPFTRTISRRLGLRRFVVTSRQAGRVVSLLLLLGLTWVLVDFFVSYAFFVYDADIQGNHLLSAQEIYEASGIDGYSIFWIQPEEVEKKLEAIPYIRKATVRCRLPHRVEIVVQERKPIILWRMKNQALWVDEEGKAMKPLQDLSGLIRIEDENGDVATENGNMDPAIALGVQQVHRLLPEVNLFYYNRSHGLQFVTPEGVQVYLGDGRDIAYKVRVMDAILHEVKREGRTVHLVDVRYKDEPYVR